MSAFDAPRSEKRTPPSSGWTPDYSQQHPEAAFITTHVQCASCAGDLLGLSTLGMCPSCGTTVRATLLAIDRRRGMAGTGKATRSTNCARCGYDLGGLDDDHVCPECGVLVALSRRGALLQFASPEYLTAVQYGAFLVQTSILLMLFSGIGAIAIMLIAAMAGSVAGAWIGLSLLLLIPVGAVGWMWGWWKFSTRDPAFEETGESSSARRRSRLFLLAYLALIAFSMFAMILPSRVGPGAHGGPAAAFMILGLLAYFGGLLLLVLQYVYSMLYVRWLALRIPNRSMADWAKTLTWLGPLTYIVGSIIVIGPLIALGFYWTLLDSMRREIKVIRRNIATGGDVP